jgi:hypothetical protein
MSTQWITDRLPTLQDAMADGMVWTMYLGDVVPLAVTRIPLGTPWQPIHKPAPYVKPKRWTVQWDSKIDAWSVYNSRRGYRFNLLLDGLKIEQVDAAQRIEDLFNEVMP